MSSEFAGVVLHQRRGRPLSCVVPAATHLHEQGGIQDFTQLLRLLSQLSRRWRKLPTASLLRVQKLRERRRKSAPLPQFYSQNSNNLSSSFRKHINISNAQVLGLINFVLYALGAQLLDNRLRAQQARQPKVCIVRTTLDRKGKPVKKVVKHQRIKVHNVQTV